MEPVWFIERDGIQHSNDAGFIRACISTQAPFTVSMFVSLSTRKLVSAEQALSDHKHRKGILNFPPV